MKEDCRAVDSGKDERQTWIAFARYDGSVMAGIENASLS